MAEVMAHVTIPAEGAADSGKATEQLAKEVQDK